MNMGRAVFSLLGLAALAGAASMLGCGAVGTAPWKAQRVHVLATIAPLACFAQNVGGDHIEVKCLCLKSGPHEYEYDVQDNLLLRDADVFFAVGLGLDDKFADKMATHSRNGRLRYLQLGSRLPENLKLHDEDDKQPGKEQDKHEHGEFDPHVWLGVPQVKAMVAMIRDELKKADPAHAEDYEANAKRYTESLDRLLADGKNQLKDKKNLKIIAFHDSLAYFAKSFGVQIAGTIELAPGAEPGANKLADLVKLCKDQDVRVIAVEPQYPTTTSAKTLRDNLQSRGFSVKMVEVDPLETAEPSQLEEPRWYENKMRTNIEELARALP
jgi:ABC-type Zn uptake system ZnuABC Zn-binding protein ZnuA